VKREARVKFEEREARVEELLERTLRLVERARNPLVWYADKQAVHVTSRVAMLKRIELAKALAARARKRRNAEVNIEKMPLGDVIKFLREITQVSFHVNWRALALVGVGEETPVTLKATNITVERALSLIVDQLSTAHDKMQRVYWLIDDGIVRIATGEALNQTLHVRVYDVTHLLLVVPNFKGPRMALSPTDRKKDSDDNSRIGIWETSDEKDAGKEEETMAEKRKKLRENLVAIIKESIGQDMWTDGGGKGSVRFLRNKLIISQTLLGFRLMEMAFQRR
jgi:hypothetical protein